MEGRTPRKDEVQLGKRTGRPRGAPKGNTNRLKHGRFSARRITRRKETNTLLRRLRNLTRRIEMMAWSRKALRKKKERIASASIVIPGERRAQSGQREGKETNSLLALTIARKLGSLPSALSRARASPGMTTKVAADIDRRPAMATHGHCARDSCYGPQAAQE